ncbi:hypothetical protein IWX49DRAFT_284070 [Phyllosticta citricarpa]|uniref:Secreted protein n=1 Tax=Phyllosticta citricarpa TaxID=55181 RepID=A0ABR1MLT4_9PEZI
MWLRTFLVLALFDETRSKFDNRRRRLTFASHWHSLASFSAKGDAGGKHHSVCSLHDSWTGGGVAGAFENAYVAAAGFNLLPALSVFHGSAAAQDFSENLSLDMSGYKRRYHCETTQALPLHSARNMTIVLTRRCASSSKLP